MFRTLVAAIATRFVGCISLAALVIVACVIAQPALAADDIDESIRLCAPLPREGGRKDYRARDSSTQMRWHYDDNWVNHTRTAVDLVQRGSYTLRVMRELNWTLDRWPNHQVALATLVRYHLAGGKQYEFEPPWCYFARAKQFSPNDIDIRLAEAFLYWRKGNSRLAERTYREALDIDPNSTDAHYNLGLLYLEMGRKEDAAAHAQAAYSRGYPLSGLKRKLAEAGVTIEAQDAPAESVAPGPH